MTTPPNPAAAQVERIVKECARSQHNQWVDDHSMNGTYTLGLNEDETQRFFADMETRIHRAIADAIAALQVGEELQEIFAELTEVMEQDIAEGAPPSLRTNHRLNSVRQALANLDAVTDKQP